MEIRGRTALVTGAGRSLGAGLARALATAGSRLALVARDETALQSVAEAIREAGGEAHVVPGDLGDERAIHRIAGAAGAVLRFEGAGDAFWTALFREGRPVQYSHLARDLELWDGQTAYATRPWAVAAPAEIASDDRASWLATIAGDSSANYRKKLAP